MNMKKMATLLLAMVLLLAGSGPVLANSAQQENDKQMEAFNSWFSSLDVYWYDAATDTYSSQRPSTEQKESGQTAVQYDNKKPAEISIESYIAEAFALANAEREKLGVHALEMDDLLMELAAQRAKELEEKYSHERPDGTRASVEYRCGEIINRRANTPKVAVDSWMNSPGHKALLTADKYTSTGIACYEGEDGVVYWVQLFKR